MNAFAEVENRETLTGKSGEMTIVLVTFTYSRFQFPQVAFLFAVLLFTAKSF